MKKLYRLKGWYTLAECAARLSLTLAETITENDVIQLAAEGNINASWFLKGDYYARKVTVFCCYPRGEHESRMTETEYDENEESLGIGLSGIYTLPVDLYPPWGWWLLSFIGHGGESAEFYDPIVIDADDKAFWAFYDRSGKSYFMNFPAKDEVVITRKDIERFERDYLHAAEPASAALPCEPLPVSPAAAPVLQPQDGPKGITKEQVLMAFEEMVKPFKLAGALKNGKGLFGNDEARTQRGTRGATHAALWNPVILAIGLNEKYLVPMPHLKRAFNEHSFLRVWADEWTNALDFLSE